MPRPVKGRGLCSLYHLLQHTAPCGGTIWFPLTGECRQGLLALSAYNALALVRAARK